MEVEFYKCHSMGTDYITVDNRSGKYDAALKDKDFCKLMLNSNYGIGGVYMNEIRMTKDNTGYEMRFIMPDGSEGYYGGSNVATTARVAKMLGLFKNDSFPFSFKGQRYIATYDTESDRFWFNFKHLSQSSITAVNKGWVLDLDPCYPNYVQLFEDVKSLDVVTLGRNLHKTVNATLNFFERTTHDDTVLGRTFSAAKKAEIPTCGSGSVAIALLNEWLKMKESNHNTENAEAKTRTVKVEYSGGTVLVSYAVDKNCNFTNIKLGLPGTYVFTGKIPFTKEN